MNTRRLPLIAVVLATLSCNLATGAPTYPAATPAPSIAPTKTKAPAPIYVPTSCQGQPIATLPQATSVAEPTLSVGTNPPLTKEKQSKLFEELVGDINKVYLYPDFNGLNWPAIVARYRAEVEGGLDTEVFYGEMERLVNALGDEHSNFESPSRAAADKAELEGINNYVGIGALVQPLLDKGRVTILITFPDSAAEHAGLKPHDSILAVDGIPLVENGKAHPQRMRGPECSAAVFSVLSPGEARRDITLVRHRVTGPLPIVARLVPTTDGSRIGYIFLPTFLDDTIPGQVKRALQGFGTLDGLVLDNRMNGGGSSSVMEHTLRYFTSGTLGLFVSRTARRPLQLTADPINNSQTVPLVVLVGKDTVSFGEVFSGVLQDAGRAKIVGQTTLGNVETLHGYTLYDGSQVWIAQERFDPAHSHADWEKDGIRPDVEAYADWDSFTFENDPSIAAAVRWLLHQ